VILTPDNNSITVFNKGIPQGFGATILAGGHIPPISIDGAKLEWKKSPEEAEKEHNFRKYK